VAGCRGWGWECISKARAWEAAGTGWLSSAGGAVPGASSYSTSRQGGVAVLKGWAREAAAAPQASGSAQGHAAGD
jgi:hypothetical protein